MYPLLMSLIEIKSRERPLSQRREIGKIFSMLYTRQCNYTGLRFYSRENPTVKNKQELPCSKKRRMHTF